MSQMDSHHPQQPLLPHHDEGDIHYGVIFKFVLYLAIFVAIVQMFTFVVMQRIDSRMVAEQEIRYPLSGEQGERLPPTPRLQTLPREEMTALREVWRQGLEGYSWVDKNAGTVRIPIEIAMRRVLERGLAVRTEQATAATATPPAPTAGDGAKPSAAPARREGARTTEP